LAYGCAFGLAWAVSTNRLPLTETFTRVLAPPAEAQTKSRGDSVAPRVDLQASLTAEPVPPHVIAPVDLEPVAAPAEEPAEAPAVAEPNAQPSTPPAPTKSEPVPAAKSEPTKQEPTREAPAPKSAEPAPPPVETSVASGGSCEAAIAAYVEDANRKAPKDLGAADFGRVLNKGDYLDRCGVPTTTAVDICVAVQNGRAVGVTVRTAPSNTKLDRCLSRVLRNVSFPSHPRMDVARTRFAN
jgi:hypothetical protein